MSNQIILWSMFFLPWLTLFFMKKEDIKHYMPVALFAIITTVIIHDTGLTFGYWTVQESAFPLNQTFPYFYGTVPVLTMWIIKFTYDRYWLYILVYAILGLGFAFTLLNNFFPNRGIYSLIGITSFQVWLVYLVHVSLLYVYHSWQTGAFVSTKRMNTITGRLQPAGAKPLDKSNDSDQD